MGSGAVGRDRLVPVALAERAAGNALVLEELIRAAAAGNEDEVPTTVGALLQARVGQLGGLARRALLAASVFGQRFCAVDIAPLVADVGPHGALEGRAAFESSDAAPDTDSGAGAGVDPATKLTQALERLLDAEMIEPDGPARHGRSAVFRFRHALMRDAAYELLSPVGARRLHQLAAEHLLTRGLADAMVVAEHLSAAGLSERAAAHYLRAAEQASSANALHETLVRAEKGLACAPSGAVATHLAAIQIWALGWSGQWDRLLTLAETALPRLEPGSAWWCRCLAMLIGVSFLTGDEPMLARMTATLFAADPAPGALVAYLDALNVGLGSGTMIGRYRLCVRYYRRALEVTTERAHEASSARAWSSTTTAAAYSASPIPWSRTTSGSILRRPWPRPRP